MVCVQAKGMKEAWCLAASDPDAKAAVLVNRKRSHAAHLPA